MTDHMLKIQEKIKDDPEVLLLSHTVFPKTDSVPVLKAYAEEKGVMDKKWNLVTIKDIKKDEEITLTYTFYKI